MTDPIARLQDRVARLEAVVRVLSPSSFPEEVEWAKPVIVEADKKRVPMIGYMTTGCVLPEERIVELWDEFTAVAINWTPLLGSPFDFARSVEREALAAVRIGYGSLSDEGIGGYTPAVEP